MRHRTASKATYDPQTRSDGRSSAVSGPFARLLVASVCSNLGDGIGLAAAPLLAALLTRDAALVAGLVVAQRLPWFLFSLVSGALVDRLDRRRVMVWGNLFRAGVLGVLAGAVAIGWANLVALYLVFFLLGTAETLVDNAAVALTPLIVPPERLERANGQMFAAQTVANEFGGPPVGGALFGFMAASPFVVHAGLFALSAALIGSLGGRFRAVERTDTDTSLWASIREGIRYFGRYRILQVLASMAGVCNFFSSATGAIFVLFAQDVLRIDGAAFGLVLALGAVGGVAGGLIADRLTQRIGTGTTIFWTNALPGIAYLGIALTTNALVVGAMFVLASFASAVGNVVILALRQHLIPNHLFGRVTSAYRMFALSAIPLGALFGGFVARRFGLATPYWIAGATMLAMACGVLLVVNNRTIQRAKATNDHPPTNPEARSMA
jgi:MFS family permease